ncbi:MAG TPA: hypothetical protein VJK52_01675, partial [Candidatus Nanoarchaeia archaeon]|nr:hypothetical protein [Candidatus Nanoarchaeia archaeon]
MDVDILGADGESIGKLPLAEARAKKLIYRVAGVIVTNSKGEILVHQRSMAQEHYGGKWAIMACAPVPVGDTYVPTAAKVVREQLRVVPPK